MTDPNVSNKPIEEGFTQATPDVYDLLNKVATSFDRFNSINPSHILIVFKNKGKSGQVATTRKIPEIIRPFLPGRHLILTLSQIEWSMMAESKKIAVLFHELMHLAFHTGKYVMLKHDVQDFREIVEKLGYGYEKADILTQEIKSAEAKSEG